MKKNQNTKIAVLTSGGDAPGMNTIIRSIYQYGMHYNYDIYLVKNGFAGLTNNLFIKASYDEINAFANLSGTFIFSARFPEFKEPAVRANALANLKKRGIEILIVIGGDGSYMGALKLSELGIKVICIPGTIDNDVVSSEYTIGFFTALQSITNAITAISSTCLSHKRIGIVEVMGRYCGDLAIFAALANNADLVITLKNVMTIPEILNHMSLVFKNKNKRNGLIIVSEHIYGENNNPTLKEIGKALTTKFNRKCNVDVLGYLQRGNFPTAMEKVFASLAGLKAIELINNNIFNQAICLINGQVVNQSLAKAIKATKANNHNDLIALINQVNLR